MRPPALVVLLLFALTLFLSATLLFLVQPMVGKMLLPLLGGTPAVWNTCMVFFQALLLAGYAYAHATTTWLGVRKQAILHLVVLLLPFLTISLTVDRTLLDYGEGSPIPGLLLVLLLSVGLPFFVVSTTAPLVQKWFAATGHPAASDPYFLYGASNLGSILALIGYPTVVEPLMPLAGQRLLWQIGYGGLVLFLALCAVCLFRSPPTAVQLVDAAAPEGATPTLRRRLRWIVLGFVPSSLMLGATTYMTTDIAAIPLLWVLPLALYLISFILVFSRLPSLVHRLMVVLLPFCMLGLVFLMTVQPPMLIWWSIPVHLIGLFVASMVCHGELARDRPTPRYLTEFYLAMSVGGVLGGLFNALLSPMIFTDIVEYPLALVVACLLTPREEHEESRLGPVLGGSLMGLMAGAGLAFLMPALGRTDLDAAGILSREGLWAALAILAGVLWTLLGKAGTDAERSARWLDLGLPIALGILTLGLHLGVRLTSVHRGLVQALERLEASLPDNWIATRISNLLDLASSHLLFGLLYILPVLLCYLFVKRPRRFGLGVGAILIASAMSGLFDDSVLLRGRSFFGAMQVATRGNFRRLDHGTTLHGWQRTRWAHSTIATGALSMMSASNTLDATLLLAGGQDTWLHPGREPQTYFHRTSPIGQIFSAYQGPLADRPIAIIGLGSGTLAAYTQSGQQLTYYEIDPLVKQIAYDPQFFTFVPDAQSRGVAVDVVLGDARLKLEERVARGETTKYALLVVDAFSSDAIPIHLLTREALRIYLDNLADDGLLAIHISNRYLNLEPVLGNLAEVEGLVGFIQNDDECDIPGKSASSWVVLAREERHLIRLTHEGRWQAWQAEQNWAAGREATLRLCAFPDVMGGVQTQEALCLALFEHLRAPWRRLKKREDVGVWTDDYSNLLKVFEK